MTKAVEETLPVALARTSQRGSQESSPPPGWQLVPVEPTEEMLIEAYEATESGEVWDNIHNGLAIAYRAMLEAAPSPSTPVVRKDDENHDETGGQEQPSPRSSTALSETQLTWLRGLSFVGGSGYVLMSASELGNPQVSELQSLGLVNVSDLLDGKNWRILPEGRAMLSAAPSPSTPVVRKDDENSKLSASEKQVLLDLSATQEEFDRRTNSLSSTETDIQIDRAYIAGAKFGWNCALDDDGGEDVFKAAIEGRMNEITKAIEERDAQGKAQLSKRGSPPVSTTEKGAPQRERAVLPTQEQINAVAAVFAEVENDPTARASAIIMTVKLMRALNGDSEMQAAIFIEPHERAEAIEAYADRLTAEQIEQIEQIEDAPETAIVRLTLYGAGQQTDVLIIPEG